MSLVPRRWGACLVLLLVLGLLSPGLARADSGDASGSCGRGDRGRLLGFERVASHPTAADARAYFDSSVSFYDAPSNPNVFGELEERGESFDGPPSSAIFAGAGFIYVAPD